MTLMVIVRAARVWIAGCVESIGFIHGDEPLGGGGTRARGERLVARGEGRFRLGDGAMIGSAFVSQVRRNVPIVGGTVSAISRMRASGMGPGPLGMRETSSIADAPNRTASSASRTDATQQTLILGGARNISATVV